MVENIKKCKKILTTAKEKIFLYIFVFVHGDDNITIAAQHSILKVDICSFNLCYPDSSKLHPYPCHTKHASMHDFNNRKVIFNFVDLGMQEHMILNALNNASRKKEIPNILKL